MTVDPTIVLSVIIGVALSVGAFGLGFILSNFATRGY